MHSVFRDPATLARRAQHEAEFKDYAERLRRDEQRIPASALTTAQKNLVWRHIKAHCPEQVEFLNDPIVQRLMAAGAVPVFEPELVREALSSDNTKAATP